MNGEDNPQRAYLRLAIPTFVKQITCQTAPNHLRLHRCLHHRSHVDCRKAQARNTLRSEQLSICAEIRSSSIVDLLLRGRELLTQEGCPFTEVVSGGGDGGKEGGRGDLCEGGRLLHLILGRDFQGGIFVFTFE